MTARRLVSMIVAGLLAGAAWSAEPIRVVTTLTPLGSASQNSASFTELLGGTIRPRRARAP